MSTPARPAALDGRAAEVWESLAPQLAAAGMLTARDVLTFALWCRLAAKLEEGELTSAVITQFRLLGNDFGLTPSGKNREATVPTTAGAHKFFDD